MLKQIISLNYLNFPHGFCWLLPQFYETLSLAVACRVHDNLMVPIVFFFSFYAHVKFLVVTYPALSFQVVVSSSL